MFNLLIDRFYWPNIHQDSESDVRSCEHCLMLKARPEVAELYPFPHYSPHRVSPSGLCH